MALVISFGSRREPKEMTWAAALRFSMWMAHLSANGQVDLPREKLLKSPKSAIAWRRMSKGPRCPPCSRPPYDPASSPAPFPTGRFPRGDTRLARTRVSRSRQSTCTTRSSRLRPTPTRPKSTCAAVSTPPLRCLGCCLERHLCSPTLLVDFLDQDASCPLRLLDRAALIQCLDPVRGGSLRIDLHWCDTQN